MPSRNGGTKAKGPEDPYLNHKVIVSSNTWQPQNGGNYTFDEVDGRDSQQTIELERPDDHLIEIHGFGFHFGDPGGGGTDSKFDCYVVNDDDAPPKLVGWPTFQEQDDDIIASGHVESDGSGGGTVQTVPDTFYEKPILSTGKLGVLCRNAPGGAGAGGEFALSVYYTYREFDENEVTQQLLQRR